MNMLEEISRVVDVVRLEFGLQAGQMYSRQRMTRFTWPRHVARALCRERLGLSFPDLGYLFGVNHASVFNSCAQVRNRCDTEPAFAARVAALRERLSV